MPDVKKTFLAVLLVAVAAAASPAAYRVIGHQGPESRMEGFPALMIWAWERPEDLRFIDSDATGVAFLAVTINVSEDDVSVRPRYQPLRVPDGTRLMAVARIESDARRPPRFTEQQRENVVAEILELAQLKNVTAVQVDFDAMKSERAFYGLMLRDLRDRLPKSTALSITALASWCTYDDWIAGLPVYEAVPMLFRMGVDDRQVRIHLNAGKDFRPGICQGSAGIATDEPVPKLPGGGRVYVFHSRAWSEEAFTTAVREVF